MAYQQLSPYRRGGVAQGGRGASGGSLFDLNRQINRLFESVFDQDGGMGGQDGSGLGGGGLLSPVVDVHQADGMIEITTELPGVKEEDIDITVEDGVLMVRGEKKSTRSDEERGYTERSYGRFERQIALPPDIDEDACSADFSDGVLTIRLPRNEEKAGRRKIQLGRGGSQGQGQMIEQRAQSGNGGNRGQDGDERSAKQERDQQERQGREGKGRQGEQEMRAR